MITFLENGITQSEVIKTLMNFTLIGSFLLMATTVYKAEDYNNYRHTDTKTEAKTNTRSSLNKAGTNTELRTSEDRTPVRQAGVGWGAHRDFHDSSHLHASLLTLLPKVRLCSLWDVFLSPPSVNSRPPSSLHAPPVHPHSRRDLG